MGMNAVYSYPYGQAKCLLEKSLWSAETKTELFGCNDRWYVWMNKGEAFRLKTIIAAVKHGGRIILLPVISLHCSKWKVDGIINKEDYLQIFMSNQQLNG